MYKYKHQMKEQKLNTKNRVRNCLPVKKCIDILTFDIEVTSAWDDPERGLITYEPGKPADYWNNLPKYSLPYIWQFSFNDTVYYGRDLRDFDKVLRDLPSDVEFIVWVHNLSYEFAFLINLYTVQKVFARTPHKPMYVIFNEHPNITFKCSYILTNLSLEKWGKQLNCNKLTGDLDYNKCIRTPKTRLTRLEMAYCERDCIVVYEGIKDHLKRYRDVWDIPNTSTGKIRRIVKKIVTNDYEYMHDMKRLIPSSAEEYERLQTLFAGGFTHANRKYMNKTIREKGEHADFASSYPYTMCAYKFPYNKWCYYGKYLPDEKTFGYRAYMIKLHFRGLRSISWNTYISGSKSRGSHMILDNGRVLAADELRILVTEQDYITICNNYEWDFIESEGTWMCQKRYLPTILVDYLLTLYQDKTALKNVPDSVIPGAPDRYFTSKQYINSCFGMMVTALFNSEVTFNSEDPEQWKVTNLTVREVEEGLAKLRVWFNKKYFLSYSVGCWITAYSRRRLWECIESGDMDQKLLYTDTDSLFYIGSHNWDQYNYITDKRLYDACKYHGFDFNRTRPKDPEGIPHPLGQLEMEKEFDAFRTLGAKKYVEERDNKLYLTVSGINKGAVVCLSSIDDFKDGFIFDKDHPDVHKMEHTYLTDMDPITYPDGYFSDLKYGINMRPTGYKLSVPTVYDSLDLLYEAVTNPDEKEIIRQRGVIHV